MIGSTSPPSLESGGAIDDATRLRAAIKPRDVWWPAVFSGPMANRIVGWLARTDRIRPNHVTVAGFAVNVAAALCFAAGGHAALVAGGLLVQAAFVLDCADGQLARYRGLASPFGEVMDRVFDRIKVPLLTAALAWGAYARGRDATVWIEAWIAALGPLFALDVYGAQYRLLHSALPPPVGGEPRPPFPTALRALDLPFVRPFCGDHLFLLTVLCLFDAVQLLLALLAIAGALQIALRPIYYVFALRREHGDWPWRLAAARRA